MSHLDPDKIALLALGENLDTDEDRAHVQSCPQCADELDQMRHTVKVARLQIDGDDLEEPPARVWDAIGEELGLEREGAPVEIAPVEVAVGRGARRRVARRRSRAVWVLAASLVLVAGAAVTVGAIVTRLNAPVVVAAASLDAFPDHAGAVGVADVREARDGSRSLFVELDTTDAADTYREVWLIRNDAGALISLGVLEGAEGTFVIPAGVDLTQYGLVDVSVEQIDGDPGHSGDSIVRGALQATSQQ